MGFGLDKVFNISQVDDKSNYDQLMLRKEAVQGGHTWTLVKREEVKGRFLFFSYLKKGHKKEEYQSVEESLNGLKEKLSEAGGNKVKHIEVYNNLVQSIADRKIKLPWWKRLFCSKESQQEELDRLKNAFLTAHAFGERLEKRAHVKMSKNERQLVVRVLNHFLNQGVNPPLVKRLLSYIPDVERQIRHHPEDVYNRVVGEIERLKKMNLSLHLPDQPVLRESKPHEEQGLQPPDQKQHAAKRRFIADVHSHFRKGVVTKEEVERVLSGIQDVDEKIESDRASLYSLVVEVLTQSVQKNDSRKVEER